MFAFVTLQPLLPDFNGDVGIMCAAWAGRNSRTTYLNIVTLDLTKLSKIGFLKKIILPVEFISDGYSLLKTL
jgi:hypothetical protein